MKKGYIEAQTIEEFDEYNNNEKLLSLPNLFAKKFQFF